MDAKYINLLLFRCKQCTAPLPVTVRSPEGTLERIDGHMLATALSNPFDHKRDSLKMPS